MWADPSVAEEAKQYLADAPNVTVQVSKAVDTTTTAGLPKHSTWDLPGLPGAPPSG
jgi:hypothetical protein